MKNRLPSLRALRTFQVVGKHLSFKEAADELFITPSAVSHQIKGLEEFLEIPLLVRKTRALEFTPAGLRYFEYLNSMFAQLETETHQLWAEYGRNIVRLCVPPFFASEILLPKLESLHALLPDTDIKIMTPPSGMKEHPAEADISVLLGNGGWPKLKLHELFDGQLAVAASPSLIKKIDIHSYDSLNGQTLIVHENRPDGWRNWAKSLGIPQPKAGKILRFDSMSAVMQAAASGLGFAIIYLPLSQQWIRSEAIRPVFDAKGISKEKFYLAHRPEDCDREDITRIIDWFFSELAKYNPETSTSTKPKKTGEKN